MKGLVVILAGVAVLWAAEGTVAPLGTYKPVERRYWAFQPRAQVTPPVFADAAAKAWIKTPVDAFILAGLRKAGLKPAAAASRELLIRRATYDLLGLPPSPQEIDAFVHDRAANAWEKVVDR